MRNKIFVILSSVSLLISCNSKNATEEVEALYSIDVTSSSSRDSLISPRELLTDVSYIPLDSSDMFFLTAAKKILELDNKLFVLDGNKEELVAYDLQGNFISKVGVKGEGPEEYKSVTDFVVDDKRNSIIVFSRADQAIVEFNSNLSFKRKVRLNTWAFQISLLESGNIAFYTYFSEKGGKNNILIYNLEGDQIAARMPYPENDQYMPRVYTGFIVGNYYTYPLSSKIFKLEEDQPIDKAIAEVIFPDRWPEEKRYNHGDFLHAERSKHHTLSKFTTGNNAEEFLFFYSFRENNYRVYTLGARLASGQVFGHLDLKHGFKSSSDLFGKLFFRGPYSLPTFSSSSGYYYVSTDIESMTDLFYANKDNALKEIMQIDKELYEVLRQERDHETSIIMRFKLRKSI